ncbi:MAG: hypothetical protein RLZZ450_1430 [Pseudomonadota bacterium]|jgi:hypothetical protein
MPIHAHEVTVALLLRGLHNLKTLLDKGEAYAAQHKLDPRELVGARLAADMYDLGGQAHWAAEGARLAGARLVGTLTSPVAAEPTTFAALHQEIDATVAYLGALDRDEVEAGLERPITLDHRGGSTSMDGSHYVLQMVLPSFFFHTTTAYAILRHKGVPLTKGDFMGALG